MIHNLVRITHTDTADEWLCHECGRHIVVQLPPNYRKIVLVDGDPNVTHYGGMKMLHLHVEINEVDPYLEPFETWDNDHQEKPL